MKTVGYIAAILLIIGGLNWGIIGLTNTNIVTSVLGKTGLDRIIYILVGLAAVWAIYEKCTCKSCCPPRNNP